MCCPNSSSECERKKLVKFVELLVDDYLRVRGFEATSAKFSEECAKSARRRGEEEIDENSEWYTLADELAFPVRD